MECSSTLSALDGISLIFKACFQNKKTRCEWEVSEGDPWKNPEPKTQKVCNVFLQLSEENHSPVLFRLSSSGSRLRVVDPIPAITGREAGYALAITERQTTIYVHTYDQFRIAN